MRKLRIAHISTFSPTQCGIATYTEDLIASIHNASAQTIRMSYEDLEFGEFDHTIPIQNEIAYDEAVAYLNDSNVDVVSLQHEFGIFGGDGGSHVLRLMRGIKKPLVTTLHTVKATMSTRKQEILSEIVEKSARLVVLTTQSAAQLIHTFGTSPSKVAVIPHGIPDVPFAAPESSNLRRRLDATVVFVSAGHRRRTKGYHLALEALARYKTINPDFKYVIIGTHQPQFHGPPAYWQDLRALVDELGMTDQVVWIDAYVSRDELLQYIMAADIGLVTYTSQEQNGSGILPLFLGCGRVVVATGFECARSLQCEVSGLILADSNSADSVSAAISSAAEDKVRQARLMKTTFTETRSWLWKKTAQQYYSVLADAAGQFSPTATGSLGNAKLITVKS
jgi:glycosyltransferase involved in cell wall biosynthesis